MIKIDESVDSDNGMEGNIKQFFKAKQGKTDEKDNTKKLKN